MDYCTINFRIAMETLETTKCLENLYFSTNISSLPRPFTPDLKVVCFTNPFLHSFLVPFGLLSWIFDLYQTRWALAFLFVLVSSFKIMLLVTCARLS